MQMVDNFVLKLDREQVGGGAADGHNVAAVLKRTAGAVSLIVAPMEERRPILDKLRDPARPRADLIAMQ